MATVVGRYYAMDRDKRWDRIKIAIDGLVKGDGENVDDIAEVIQERYNKDETDEFLKPLIVNGDAGRIKGRLFYRDNIESNAYSFQMAIPCSASTIAPTACVRFRVYLDALISLWKSTSPKIWCAIFSSISAFH